MTRRPMCCAHLDSVVVCHRTVWFPAHVKFLLVFPASTVSSLRIGKHPRFHHAAVKKGVMRLIIFFWFRPLRPHPKTTSDLYTPIYYLLSSLEVVSVVTPLQTWEIMLKNPTTCVVRTWSGRGHNTQMDPNTRLKPRPITTLKPLQNSGPIIP